MIVKSIDQVLLDKRATIISAFEAFETNHCFLKTPWNYKHEGGGEIALLKGEVFEKAAVNFSSLKGPQFPMDDAAGAFSACGVSLITHMQNPFIPTAHLNIRLIQTDNKYWIGGGYDLTPMADIDPYFVNYFHACAKECLDRYDLMLYREFKKNADQYFYIPHRQKTRGVGGIFFDHFSFEDKDKDSKFLEDIADSFLKAYLPIINHYQNVPYTAQDKENQQRFRAHYVEFNLIYDRGTKFGFLSGGNPEAILCSMPPCAKW